jgi:uncharacterized protein YbjT (DUF2867 family)
MKVVVIGGTGLIGSKLVARLSAQRHDVRAASLETGVNALTGEGLDAVMVGASTVVDVTNSPSFEDAAVLNFFETSTRNLLAAEVLAGVSHHVALSVVGSERLPESGYFRAKIAQEQLIRDAAIACSVIRATQFFEFVGRIADDATVGNIVHVAPVLCQPMAADDVASALASTVVNSPVNGTLEIAGPEQFRLDEFIRRGLKAHGDPREVVADPHARYFGAELSERSLVPGDGARPGQTRFDDWLNQSTLATTHTTPPLASEAVKGR